MCYKAHYTAENSKVGVRVRVKTAVKVGNQRWGNCTKLWAPNRWLKAPERLKK